MKILCLKLDAFGPFTGVALDLSAGNHGLHLIYGPNEAGKTSSLRAIRQLFYGIPGQSPDNFVHPYRSMRLGAALQRGDGARLEFVRFKRNKNPVCGADGETPLAPGRLEGFLGGVDETLFASLFGIDHDRLVQGGQEIASGGGKLGNLLFSATSGLSNLRGVQQRLQEESGELFKFGGRNQRIPRAVSELRAAQVQIRGLQLSSDRWTRHEQTLRAALAQKNELEARWLEKDSESNRLKRIAAALPLFSARGQLLEEYEGYRDAIALPADFPDRRRRAQDGHAAAAQELKRAGQALRELEARRDELELPTALLAAVAEIEALRDQRAAILKAQADRPQLATRQWEDEHAARDILESLGQPRELSAAGSIRLRVDEPPRITQLGHEFTQLDTRRSEARAAILEHSESLERTRRELDELGAMPDLSPLRSALRLAQKDGDLEARLAQAQAQLAPLEKEIASALRRLPGGPLSREQVEQLAAPLAETVSRYDAELRQAVAAVGDLERARAQEEKEAVELETRIREQALRHDVPTEEDLQAARKLRDDGWAIVRRAWLEGVEEPPAAAAFVGRFPPARSMAEAIESAIAQADSLADRLRREAESVARKAEWLSQLERRRKLQAQSAAELSAAVARRDSLTLEWEELLRSSGLPALAPPELRAWLSLREKLIERIGQARDHKDQSDRLEQLIAAHQARLRESLALLSPGDEDSDASLAARVDRAQDCISRHEAREKKRVKLDAGLAREQAQRDSFKARLSDVESELERWRGHWAGYMTRIGLDQSATPEQAGIVLTAISKLFQHLEKASGFQSRIRGIDRDVEQFDAAVEAVAARVAPELAGGPSAEAADQLAARLQAAREQAQRRRSLEEQIENESVKLAEAERALAASSLEIASLCRDAGCETADELLRAEQRSARRAALEADLGRCEAQIRQHSAGASVEAFARETRDIPADSLNGSLSRLQEEVQEIQRQLEQVNQSIGSEQTQLDQMNGSGKAAEANELVGFALAQLQEDVPRYAALRLATRVLQQGIERYRERNQGPVLARASELFAALTLGSFEGLRVETGQREEAVVEGVRPGGAATLTVDAMSTGSCDQLYLAIRLAYLENWLRAHEPIPFIVDDVLLQFDDDRAVAALRVLAELSASTQVIFFTHHAHLVGLARSHLDPGVLHIQTLPAGAAAAAGSGRTDEENGADGQS